MISVTTLTQADDGRLVSVGLGDVIKVSLAENPTTGYRWAADALDMTVLQLQDSTYSLNPGGGIGGGGIRTMTFQAASPGSARLKLKLWREWGGDASITNRFSVTVTVQH